MDPSEDLGFNLDAGTFSWLYDDATKTCGEDIWNIDIGGDRLSEQVSLENICEGAQNMQQGTELKTQISEVDQLSHEQLCLHEQELSCNQNNKQFEKPCAIEQSPASTVAHQETETIPMPPKEIHWQLNIIKQPDKEYQFSSPTDIREKKNRITGSGGRNNDITIELNCDSDDRNYLHAEFHVFIWCTLWQFPCNNKKTMHRLIQNGSNNILVLLPMAFVDGKWKLHVKDLHVIKTKSKDEYNVLCKKYEEFEKFRQQKTSLSKADEDRIMNLATDALNPSQNHICMRFQAFTKEKTNWCALTGPVFSEGFAEKMQLTNINPSEANIFGGAQITINTKQSLVDTENLSIFIKECNKGELSWEYNEDLNIAIKNPNTLTFLAPPYGGAHSSQQTIVCKVFLKWPDNRQSKPIKFVYRNPRAAIQKKREICVEPPSPPEAKRRNIFTDSIRLHTQGFKYAEVQCAGELAFSDKHQTIRHSGISSIPSSLERQRSNFDQIKNVLKLKNINEDFVKSNDYNGNILHQLCQMSSNDFNQTGFETSTLLNQMQEMICEQNHAWQTPLHIALRVGQQECLQIFMELFICYEDYNSIIPELEGLFRVYDGDGLTVLHLAVLQNNIPLVGIMLEFAKAHEIDVCAIGTLGNGDTILHLAESNDLCEMAELIMEKLPDADQYENYAGERPEGKDRVFTKLSDLLKHTTL